MNVFPYVKVGKELTFKYLNYSFDKSSPTINQHTVYNGGLEVLGDGPVEFAKKQHEARLANSPLPTTGNMSNISSFDDFLVEVLANSQTVGSYGLSEIKTPSSDHEFHSLFLDKIAIILRRALFKNLGQTSMEVNTILVPSWLSSIDLERLSKSSKLQNNKLTFYESPDDNFYLIHSTTVSGLVSAPAAITSVGNVIMGWINPHSGHYITKIELT